MSLRSCSITLEFTRLSSRWNYSRKYQANLLTANLCEKGRTVVAGEAPVIQNFSNMVSVKYDKILKPVNGMICFTDTSRDFGVRIYNLGTRELAPWLEAEFEIKQGSRFDYTPCYQFGFDPATKEHKVICLLQNFNAYGNTNPQSSYAACKVLTVGNNAWRTIEELPQHDLQDGAFGGSLSYTDSGSVYVNGCVYWITDQLQYNQRGSAQKVIVAFDVGSEKFSSFEIPNFITPFVVRLNSKRHLCCNVRKLLVLMDTGTHI